MVPVLFNLQKSDKHSEHMLKKQENFIQSNLEPILQVSIYFWKSVEPSL